MPKKKRTYDVRRICLTQSYSVQEIAELFDIHKNSVLQWKKQGLKLIDGKKPYLIHGTDLADFLKDKQSARKQRLARDEFYCCKCRAPRKPWGNLVDLIPKNQKTVTLRAICSVCETTMNRLGATLLVAEYQDCFAIETQPQKHLVASQATNVKCVQNQGS